MKLNIASLLSVAAVLLCFTGSAVASPIVGTLRISGQAIVSNTDLNFLCEPASGLVCDESTEGNAFAGFVQEGDFDDPAFEGKWSSIKDLSAASQPIGVDFTLMDFITFSTAPDYQIVLTNIAFGGQGAGQCAAPPTVPQHCTPPGSAFNLSNSIDSQGRFNSTADFTVSGYGYRGSQATGYSFFTGTFSADFNQSYQAVLAQLATGGSITAPYSASFEFTPIPEPGSMSLMLFGGVAAFTTRLLRRRRQS